MLPMTFRFQSLARLLSTVVTRFPSVSKEHAPVFSADATNSDPPCLTVEFARLIGVQRPGPFPTG